MYQVNYHMYQVNINVISIKLINIRCKYQVN